jgi:predicted ATPase/DNA-binding CsgD family transcriptional regulator
MPSMLLLLNDHLASANGNDAARAGRRVRPRRDVPGRGSLLGRALGRRGVPAELAAALDRAAAGRGGLVFVAGESGVGKSRLVDHFGTQARKAGARVLWGDCVELGDSELPYGAIVSALRPLVRRGDAALDDLGAARHELARLIPELGEAGDLRVEPLAGSAQGRLFELLLGLFDRLSRDAPVVLVVDDLHWADRSTRDFLAFLARNVCTERLLVIATYRVDELHRRHPLRPFLAEAERFERAQRLPVERFTRDELAAQVEAILGEPPDPELLDRMWARSEGNALYAEELLAAERDGFGDLPESLRDALMLRVEALSDEAQEALRWVAAAQRIEHDLLAEVSGIEPRALRDALREAVAHHVLVGHADGTYAFRHALLREAVHDDLLPGEAAELHHALARGLDTRMACETCVGLLHAAAIAHHYDMARDQPNALRSAVRAAAAAERASARSEAATLYERALELWDRVGDPQALAGCDHAELLFRAACAHDQDGARAGVLARAALEEVDRAAEPARAALMLERLGKSMWDVGKGDAAMAVYDEALALLPVDPPSEERARLLGAKATHLMLQGRLAEGDALADEALAAARAAGSAWAEMNALNTKGVCRLGAGDAAHAEALLRAAIAMSRAEGDDAQLARGFLNLSDVLHIAGRTRDAYNLLDEGLAELRESGHRGTWLIFQRAEMAFHLGLWEESDALLSPAMEPRHEGMTLVFYLLRRAELELARGEHASARARLQRAQRLARRVAEPQWQAPITAMLATLERRERDVEAAREQIATGLARIGHLEKLQDGGRLARILAAAAGVEADAAEQARALGRAGDEAEAIAAAEDFARRTAATSSLRSSAAMPETAAFAIVAAAEAARATGRPDPELWATAADAWRTLEQPVRVARNRAREADARLLTGDRPGAEAAAGEAMVLARRLGAVWLQEEVAALARRGRLKVEAPIEAVPAPAQPAAPADEAAAEQGLTPREREVLALVAEGRTNREIGEVLYMAEKTASVHVSRILGKLDVRSRTEAAAVAHRLGLAVGGDRFAAAG